MLAPGTQLAGPGRVFAGAGPIQPGRAGISQALLSEARRRVSNHRLLATLAVIFALARQRSCGVPFPEQSLFNERLRQKLPFHGAPAVEARRRAAGVRATPVAQAGPLAGGRGTVTASDLGWRSS